MSETTTTPTLDTVSTDLTKAAREGKLDPMIGREREVERLIHILSRRTKIIPFLLVKVLVSQRLLKALRHVWLQEMFL